MNIITAWDLAQQDAKSMRKLFSVVVEKTIRELRGEPCYGLEEGPEPKQMIACSRSFSERVTELEPLREAVATYASRAAEKLRKQGDACQMMQVPLPYPTNDTRDLIQAALTGMQAIYLPGYRYQKAGVVLMHFVNPAHLQGDLFAPKPRWRSAELMTALDKINTTMGRGTVRLARVPASGRWAMKQQLKSPSYTCRWGELPSVR
jgi:DNA polymerase V